MKAFGTVDIIAKSLRGHVSIKLLNVTLITAYFTYLVCLDRFEQKGIFHDSKNLKRFLRAWFSGYFVPGLPQTKHLHPIRSQTVKGLSRFDHGQLRNDDASSEKPSTVQAEQGSKPDSTPKVPS